MKRVFIIIAITTCLSFLYVYQHITIMELSYKMDSLKTREVVLVNENKFLQIELINLKSLNRIEKLAKEFGMVNPTKYRIIRTNEQ